MSTFLSENFLLGNKTSQLLYHDYARKMPIIDYHNHLPTEQIARDQKFENITQPWLYGDHYKWRAMRTNGVNEKFITGEADDWQKFEKWAETVPYTMRNPLYHWTHLELERYFGINEILNPSSSRNIYDRCNEQLQDNLSVNGMIEKMNAEVLVSTDDPIDQLEYHQSIAKSNMSFKVLPGWRPDNVFKLENTEGYSIYIEKLSEVSGISIDNYESLLEALKVRIEYFHNHGCRISDHGIDEFYAEEFTDSEIDNIFRKALSKNQVDELENRKFKTAILIELAKMYHEKNWVQQFHYGALRNVNSRMFSSLGPDTGWDSINDISVGNNMSSFFNRIDSTNQLTKSIIYNLNPTDNELVATMTGNFNDGSFPGKMQFGTGWWFMDQKDGMEKQINALSNMGLLSRFVGMLTDSRSFLSFPRHEYFRRILCNMFGNDIENGELPNDIKWVGKLVQDICYYNAKNYFDFD